MCYQQIRMILCHSLIYYSGDIGGKKKKLPLEGNRSEYYWLAIFVLKPIPFANFYFTIKDTPLL